MYFRNLVFSAFALSIVAGSVLSVYQAFFITPIIVASEVYEVAEIVNHKQTNEHEAWAPEDGIERHGWNFTSNFLVSFAFALILLSAISLKSSVTMLEGVFWGGAAYLTVFAAPALGLPPELPGMEAAYLEGRQSWWLFTVCVTALSLWLIAYQAMVHKIIGLLLLISPHIIGAPQPYVHGFINTNPQAIESLTLLWHQFIIQTSIANLLLWLLIGMGSGFLVNKVIQPLEAKNKADSA
jgi:cobalt transporter subunit CbtA